MDDGIIYYAKYDRLQLGRIIYHKDRRNGDSANLIICADTETSRTGTGPDPVPCYVVAWSLAVLNYNDKDHQLAAYYGHTPQELIAFITRLRSDIGARITVYFHNLSYDYTFLRQAAHAKWGTPAQLATRPHKPLQIRYSCGVTFQDSLILAQRSLEKWATDMDAPHKKAVGAWEYEKIRTQHEQFTPDELLYIGNDVKAQAECIDAMRRQLNITPVDDMPITSTGIIRREGRKRARGDNRKINRWRKKFLNMAPDLPTLRQLERAYHGGYVHANRYVIGDVIPDMVGSDFTSAYPFTMMAYKFPMECFRPFEGSKEDILQLADRFAFLMDVLIIDFDLKRGCEMPYLQKSKLIKYSDDIITDNGRVISGTMAEITYTEIDLQLFLSLYDCGSIYISGVRIAKKDYLPDWMRGYIAELFYDKCALKGGDPVAYSISKTKINGLYGLCVEKYLKPEWIEDPETGEYQARDIEDPAAALEKKYQSSNTFLPYQWGVWVCSYTARQLFRMGACYEEWIYSDTDSCKGCGLDMAKLEALNNEMKADLVRAGFQPPVIGGKEYWLGVADIDSHYSEFVTLGAKRYAYRDQADGKLHITVAGVPKKTGAACLQDDIRNFREGFIFRGSETGKLRVTYNLEPERITEDGIYIADSVDLTPDDYTLSATRKYDGFTLYYDTLPFDY